MAATSVIDLLGHDCIKALHRPTAEACGLPGQAYYSPEFLELERRTVFARTWAAVASANQLPKPGDVLPVDLAGWALLLVRDNDGTVRCFHNICRHRGAAVVAEACSGQRVLRCPWHAWTYALDGTLKGTPEFGGIGCHTTDGLDREQLGLVQVRCEQWFDVLFVNLDGEAPSLDKHLTPLRKRFEALEFSRCHYAQSWDTHYPCNWKLAVESGIEDLHLPWLHPEITNGASRGQSSGVMIGEDCFFGVYGISDKWAEGRVPDKVKRLPRLPGLSGDDAKSMFFVNIFPNAVMGITVDNLYFAVWLPDGVERTRMTFHHYFADDSATAEAYAASRENVLNSVKHVFGQDKAVVATVQARTKSRDDAGIDICFSPFWETAVHAFQKQVVAMMLPEKSAE